MLQHNGLRAHQHGGGSHHADLAASQRRRLHIGRALAGQWGTDETRHQQHRSVGADRHMARVRSHVCVVQHGARRVQLQQPPRGFQHHIDKITFWRSRDAIGLRCGGHDQCSGNGACAGINDRHRGTAPVGHPNLPGTPSGGQQCQRAGGLPHRNFRQFGQGGCIQNRHRAGIWIHRPDSGTITRAGRLKQHAGRCHGLALGTGTHHRLCEPVHRELPRGRLDRQGHVVQPRRRERVSTGRRAGVGRGGRAVTVVPRILCACRGPRG